MYKVVTTPPPMQELSEMDYLELREMAFSNHFEEVKEALTEEFGLVDSYFEFFSTSMLMDLIGLKPLAEKHYWLEFFGELK
jgi:hypothetical protein